MILLLDSTRGNEVRVGIANGRLRSLAKRFDYPASSQLLGLVDALLRKHRMTVHELRGIVVANGPGPFSALRTACALANALSFALNVPAVGVRGEMTMCQLAEKGRRALRRARVGVPIVPHYGKLPNITRPKRP